MNILIIGDQQLTGVGLPTGQVCYFGHFIRQISRAGQAVALEAQAHTDLAGVNSALAHLPLESYDLIIWQSGQGCLENQASLRFANRWLRAGQYLIERLRYTISREFTYTPRVISQLDAILKQLRPQRHKVLLMTPLVQQNRQVQWWREQGRQLLLEKGYQQGFSTFDTSLHIRPALEYFLDQYPDSLNAAGHELLGRALFDFYQSAPTIVAIRPVKKN